MPTTQGPNPRHVLFSRFVKRACDQAKLTKDWGVIDVAAASGVAKSTIYRWMSGDFELSPRGDDVEAFCDSLDIPVEIPLTILWPGRHGRRRAPAEPLPMDEDFQAVLRKLHDPAVGAAEKYHIQETIRGLAARPTSAQPERPAQRRRTG